MGIVFIRCYRKRIPEPPKPGEAQANAKIVAKQRRMETSIRKAKHQLEAAELLGDEVGIQHFKQLIRTRQGALRQLIDDNSGLLHRSYGRESVYSKPSDSIIDAHKEFIKQDKESYETYKRILGKENFTYSLEDYRSLIYNKENTEELEKLKLALKDKKLQETIRKEYNLKIHEGKQGKHIIGHNNRKDGKSYLLPQSEFNDNWNKEQKRSYKSNEIPKMIEFAQELVDKYAGTGLIERHRGKFVNKELIVIDEFIGSNVNIDNSIPFTNRFYIHYSKKDGTHVVPTVKGSEGFYET